MHACKVAAARTGGAGALLCTHALLQLKRRCMLACRRPAAATLARPSLMQTHPHSPAASTTHTRVSGACVLCALARLLLHVSSRLRAAHACCRSAASMLPHPAHQGCMLTRAAPRAGSVTSVATASSGTLVEASNATAKAVAAAIASACSAGGGSAAASAQALAVAVANATATAWAAAQAHVTVEGVRSCLQQLRSCVLHASSRLIHSLTRAADRHAAVALHRLRFWLRQLWCKRVCDCQGRG